MYELVHDAAERLARHQDPSVPALPAEPSWLSEVRLRALRRVLFLRHQWQRSVYPGEEQLAISHSEVDWALRPEADVDALAAAFYRQDDEAAAVTRSVAALGDQPPDPAWAHLVDTLHVGTDEERLLKLAFAVAADPRLARVLGYVEDATTGTGATVALARQLFEDPTIAVPGPGSAALRWKLLHPDAAPGQLPDDGTVFHAEACLLDALLGRRPPGDWTGGTTGRVVPAPPDGGLRPGLARDIAVFASQVLRSAGPEDRTHVEAELVAPSGSGRRTLAAVAADLLHATLLAVDCASFAEAADPELLLVREVRRAVLSRAALALSNHEALPPAVRSRTADCPLTFSCVAHPLPASDSPSAPGTTVRASFTVPPLHQQQRLALWSRLSAAPAPGPVRDWQLRPAEIAVAARALPAGEAAVADVCRRLLTSGLDDLLSLMPSGPTWDDLVLPPDTVAHLRELEGQMRHKDAVLEGWGLARLTPLGRGTTALFCGPSGTGKTMTAQVLAHSLGLDCLRVDLAGVVSKYIGDTEKQLRRVFEACERAPALLFFDEADALFGKRTAVNDAHDRFANIEIDYVLQAMERFDGLAVLATNRKGDLDPAFVRRLRFVVPFVPPSPSERETLWRKCFDGVVDDAGRPLAEDLDYGHLSEHLDLTGAQIKSAALAAAYAACQAGTPVRMPAVMAAARREIEKVGKVVRAGQLEWR